MDANTSYIAVINRYDDYAELAIADSAHTLIYKTTIDLDEADKLENMFTKERINNEE